MIKYFGSKWRSALRYPVPKYATIIEPFAGGAGYSLRYPDHNIVLIDKDPIIISIWRYLQTVTPDEILALPDVDTSVDDLDICQQARWLIGFWLNTGARSCKTPSSWMRSGINPGSFWGESLRRRIAAQVARIRHWEMHCNDYAAIDVPEPATWFVDPPYQMLGMYYRYNRKTIDYAALAEWCKTRPGQVIVCEQEGADWLPFKKLIHSHTARHTMSSEVIWTNA